MLVYRELEGKGKKRGKYLQLIRNFSLSSALPNAVIGSFISFAFTRERLTSQHAIFVLERISLPAKQQSSSTPSPNPAQHYFSSIIKWWFTSDYEYRLASLESSTVSVGSEHVVLYTNLELLFFSFSTSFTILAHFFLLGHTCLPFRKSMLRKKICI